ncbi:NAD(P) transhydrogenase subunit beta, partial [Porphyromonas crevioricanis]
MISTSVVIISTILSLAVLLGIAMMSRVKTAVMGNTISAFAMLVGIVLTIIHSDILSAWTIYPALIVGALIGGVMAQRVKMIQMPQLVALFNGLGGGASALVGILSASMIGFIFNTASDGYIPFIRFTSMLAIAVGMITLVGSLVAAGKLHRLLPQKPIFWPFHSVVTILSLVVTLSFIMLSQAIPQDGSMSILILGCVIFSGLFGLYFSVRVGGADMPITISLLNSLSGVAGSIAGMAIGDIFLVAVGGIVGASGLLLTQIMCRAMNRSLVSILMGVSNKPKAKQSSIKPQEQGKVSQQTAECSSDAPTQKNAGEILAAANSVIIVPGYGMALAQAQHQVKQLADELESRGACVRYAI